MMPSLFESENQRYAYPLTPSSIVLDAGAYKGEWSDEIFRLYGCRIIAAEPIPEFATECAKRFSGNPLIEVHPVALGAFDGSIKFGISNNSSGLYSTGDKKIDVDVVTIGTLMKRANVDEITLAKFNTEGSEYGCFEQAIKDKLLPKIKYLQIQWHWNAPRAEDRYRSILRELLETHDHTWGEDPTLWQSYTRKS